MPEKPGFLNAAERLLRRATQETDLIYKTDFIYDPNFTTTTETSKSGLTATTPWKRNPDGTTTIGKQQVEMAIEYAKKQKSKYKKDEAERFETAIGLSVAHIRENFPQALKDAGYDE